MQSFEELYNKLNQQQQDAVNAIDGPVMVIAGPGTGKTQILATRILNILSKTDTQPQNILCLTYTDAGAIAMQKRLSQFMGAEAFKVPIHTFHGLCNKIIQDNPEKFSKKQLRVMDELDKIDLIQGIIESLPAQSALKTYQEDAQSVRRDLSKMWELMQSEGITVHQVSGWALEMKDIEKFKEAFPSAVYKRKGPNNEVGDLKTKDFDEMHKSWKKASEAAELFSEYKSKKASAGLYEFADMLEWVANAFDHDEDLLLDSQERYHYILVDEFQDTSGLQNRILANLTSYWGDEPNCFVVGDDDQSVYAFQGAKVSNMLDFANRYQKKLKTIVLTQNYRSTQPILDLAQKTISNNQQRLVFQMPGLSKNLEASGENRNYPQVAPCIYQFKNEFHESVGIAYQILELIKNGCNPNEIAVLYPFNKHSNTLIDAFEEVGVPYVIHRPVNILNETLIRHLCLWLEYLSLELELANSGEHLIYQLLISPLYEISSYEVNQLSVDIYSQRSSNSRNGGSTYFWRDHINNVVNQPEQTTLFSASTSLVLRELWNYTEKWIKEASWLTLPELIQRLYSEGGFLSFALKSNDQEWALELLQSFMQYATRMNEKNPFMKPHEFLGIIRKMQSNDITVPLEKRIGSAEGVQFVTAHSSKGLEYEHVFVVRLNPKEWEDSGAGRMPYKIIKLLQSAAFEIKNETTAEEDAEEKRRLFYVAITRAKKSLTLSFNQFVITPTKVNEAQASKFIFESSEIVPTNSTEIAQDKLLFVQKALLMRSSKPKLADEKRGWIEDRTRNFKFSPSTLFSILDCGLKFYFTRIVRVPDAPSPAAAFGTAMHAAMRIWVDRWTHDKNWLSESEVLQQFEKEMYRQRHGFNEKQFKLRLQQGKDLIPHYYKARTKEFKAYSLVHTEKKISAVIAGIPIFGFLDKLVFDGKRVTIIDYKTGKPENSEKKSKAPSARTDGKLPNAYWFQLGVYQLMVNNQTGKDWQCNTAMIDCVEKNEAGEFPLIQLHYSQEDNELITSLINEANRKLNALEFMVGCAKPDCYWCNFAKSTDQVKYESEEDEKDDFENLPF